MKKWRVTKSKKSDSIKERLSNFAILKFTTFIPLKFLKKELDDKLQFEKDILWNIMRKDNIKNTLNIFKKSTLIVGKDE